MKRTRITAALAAGMAATGLLAGVALARAADGDDMRISTLAHTTTAVGEAKGDVISAAARDADDRMVSEDKDRDADDRAKAEDKDRDADDRAKHADRDAHGDAVSAVAHNKATKGEAHGDAVSTAAHSH